MKRIAVLVLSLIAAVLASPAALAEVVVVPSGPVLADGRTASTVRLWIPDMMPGEKFKVRPAEGRASELVATGPGLYHFTFIGPKVTTPSSLDVTLQRRGGILLDESFTLDLVPPYEGSLKITFDPPTVLAGTDTALVKVTPTTSTTQGAEGRRFQFSASAGTFDTPMPKGDGSWMARYTPPADLQGPRTVIVTAVDSAAPDAIFGWGVLPVRARQSVSIQVPADATTVLQIGNRSYGPQTASPAGTVAFDVELDNVTTIGRVQAVTPLGKRTDLTVDLPRQPYARLAIVPLPAVVPADPTHFSLPVRVVVTDATGAPARSPIPEMQVSAGQLSAVTAAAEVGVFAAVWVPPAVPTTATLTATYEGFSATTNVSFVPSMPRLDLAADPAELPKNARDVRIVAKIRDAAGTAVIGNPPNLTVKGAKLVRTMVDNGDGTYTGTFKLDPKAAKVTVLGAPPLAASGLHPYRLLVWAQRPFAPADGISKVTVTVVAVDRYGLPVEGVDVVLSVPKGDAVIAPSVTTDRQGLAQADLVVGTRVGLVDIRATAAGLVAETPLYLLTAGVTPPTLEPGGESERLEALGLWRSAVATLVIPRVGGAVVTGPPATLTVSTIPPYTTPGAAILLSLTVSDAGGSPLSGLKPKVTASLGTVGAITDNKDGSYNLPVQLPAGKDGPIDITVTVGQVSQSLTLPTFVQTLTTVGGTAATPGVPAAAGVAPSGLPAVAPVAADAPEDDTPRPARVRRPLPSGTVRFRLQAGLAALGHDYLARATSEDFLDIPASVSFRSANLFRFDFGGAPAVTALGTYRLGGTGWAADGDLAIASERVDLSGTILSTPTWEVRLGGRRYFPFEKHGLYAFGVGGIHTLTALQFRYSDDTRTSATMARKSLWGLRAGGGMGLEKTPWWWEADLSLSYLLPISPMVAFRTQVAYEFRESMYAFAGLSTEHRWLKLPVTNSEEKVKIWDVVQPITIGVGGAWR
ncbi:MAG: Ig-like domain-containing protein [Deltaproteobacteria bacterium]|nr:Ig-like domain-containing protein [Deltaproteobacteria bacterium]